MECRIEYRIESRIEFRIESRIQNRNSTSSVTPTVVPASPAPPGLALRQCARSGRTRFTMRGGSTRLHPPIDC